MNLNQLKPEYYFRSSDLLFNAGYVVRPLPIHSLVMHAMYSIAEDLLLLWLTPEV